MATDVDVQFFSHLNGLTLGNNWGDLIRLLDKALVTGINFTEITSASIDEQGDVHITLYAAHNAMLFQVVELSGFTPDSLNQKYRIKGVPSATQLILKPKIDIAERAVTTRGTGKLASLGYEIIFRDTNDVKRVYRAKNPTAQHPFIRVDESLASDSGSYTSTYAKFAMVGLLEHMDHIDDYQNPDVLQLPFDPSNPNKNWSIKGQATSCIRGWAKWYWATSNNITFGGATASTSPSAGSRRFTLCGSKDAFYFLNPWVVSGGEYSVAYGCGIYRSNAPVGVIPPWFLFAQANVLTASTQDNTVKAGTPLLFSSESSKFIVPKFQQTNKIIQHVFATPILIDNLTGMPSSPLRGTALAALEIPFYDENLVLRGVLNHVCYAGNNLQSISATTPLASGSSMYIADKTLSNGYNLGGLYFYLGELE